MKTYEVTLKTDIGSIEVTVEVADTLKLTEDEIHDLAEAEAIDVIRRNSKLDCYKVT